MARENHHSIYGQKRTEVSAYIIAVFGLVVHFKTIDGLTDNEIRDAQDEYIIEAIRQYKHNERIGWDQLSTAIERQVES